jgi:EAL domain-containing protein (putative c-di-GMP-specific phosphodiesterase class I)
LGESLGLGLLPTMFTPFGAGSLRDGVASLLTPAPPPAPAIDVAEALKAGWLELWYQPKVDVHGLVPSGAEALIRMRHPTWGVVAPSAFMPDEADPHFRALSDFVIRRVIEDWQYLLGEQGPIDISINLPASFLNNADTVRTLRQALPAHPAFGGLLIEIGAAEIVANLDLVVEAATRLGLHNVAIAVDNLGADWPALMGLEVFPFAELKVDRQFIAGCNDDRLKQTVCRGIIDLAKSRGARTAAIGIETRAELATALNLGFDLLQGHLFGKPMPVRKFAQTAVRRPAFDAT